MFLTLNAAEGAELLDCFMTVQRQVAVHGGELAVGWSIWQTDEVLLEAERHGVWRNPDGGLVDLTPKPNGAETSLFVEDIGGAYDGRQVQSKFKKLVELPELDEHIACADAIFEFMNRGERATQHGELKLNGREQEEWKGLQLRRGKAAFELGLAVRGKKW